MTYWKVIQNYCMYIHVYHFTKLISQFCLDQLPNVLYTSRYVYIVTAEFFHLDLFLNVSAQRYGRDRSSLLLLLCLFQDVDGTSEGGEVVARLSVEERRVCEPPHVLSLNLGPSEPTLDQHPYKQGQEI